MGTVSWGGSEQNLILPDQTLRGFIIASYGLPEIRNISAKPDYIATEEEILRTGISEEEYIENTWNVLNEFYENITFHAKTIGPTAPPAEFDPIAFIDYILSLRAESSSLGWIKNRGIEQSLDTKLENAKKDLQKGNEKAAINILEALINEVEAQGCETYEDCPPGKHLTSEAYALLKYNAEYLIEKLK